MKKLYTTLVTSAFTLFASAATFNVDVTSNAFTPANFTCNIGDVVQWTFLAGPHTSTSGVVPGGAASWDSGSMSSGTFTYNVTVSGNYGYGCTFHALSGMVGQFMVNPAGIFDPSTTMGSLFYPNPCLSKVTVVYEEGDQVLIYDMLGNKVKTVLLDATINKMEIDLGTLPQGTYFFRIMKEGEIMSINKIVKA